jgi:hypothetical protein
VTVTSSWDGSASPPNEAATPATGASGATIRNRLRPYSPANSAAIPANRVTVSIPSSQAPRKAGTAASSRADCAETPNQPRRRSEELRRGASTCARIAAQARSTGSWDITSPSRTRQSGHSTRWASTDGPTTESG